MGAFRHNPGRDGKKLIGISGGMSVTPLRSMARAVVDGSLDADLTLFCGWDRADEVLYREEFRAYEEVCPRFRAVFTVAEGAKGCETGYVNLEMLRRHTDPVGAAFFLCGPAPMYEALGRELLPLGIPMEKYHRELPGEAWDPSRFPGYPSGVPAGCVLTVAQGSAVYRVPADTAETVLAALERAGLSPPARCRSGVCGFCGTRLTFGKVFVPPAWERRTETEEDRAGRIHPLLYPPAVRFGADPSRRNAMRTVSGLCIKSKKRKGRSGSEIPAPASFPHRGLWAAQGIVRKQKRHIVENKTSYFSFFVSL